MEPRSTQSFYQFLKTTRVKEEQRWKVFSQRRSWSWRRSKAFILYISGLTLPDVPVTLGLAGLKPTYTFLRAGRFPKLLTQTTEVLILPSVCVCVGYLSRTSAFNPGSFCDRFLDAHVFVMSGLMGRNSKVIECSLES